jgi:hypothetical protein
MPANLFNAFFAYCSATNALEQARESRPTGSPAAFAIPGVVPDIGDPPERSVCGCIMSIPAGDDFTTDMM